MKNPLLAISLLSLCLVACGKPELKIDSSQVEAAAGATPVGLLEVHRANSGAALGVSVGETQAESAFCAATVVGSDRIVTSSDCVRQGSQSLDPGQMEFHLNEPGTTTTSSWRVASVRRLKGVAYITLRSSVDDKHAPTKLSLLAASLPIGDTQKEIAARIIFLPPPNKKGLSVATPLDTKVLYNPQGVTYSKTYVNASTGMSSTNTCGQTGNGASTPTGAPVNNNANTNGNLNYPNNRYNNGPRCRTVQSGQPDQAVTETVSTSFTAQMSQAGTLGSPVVVNGQVVGVLSNPGQQPGVDNVRWLDPRGEQSSITRQKIPAAKPTVMAPSAQPMATAGSTGAHDHQDRHSLPGT